MSCSDLCKLYYLITNLSVLLWGLKSKPFPDSISNEFSIVFTHHFFIIQGLSIFLRVFVLEKNSTMKNLNPTHRKFYWRVWRNLRYFLAGFSLETCFFPLYVNESLWKSWLFKRLTLSSTSKKIQINASKIFLYFSYFMENSFTLFNPELLEYYIVIF